MHLSSEVLLRSWVLAGPTAVGKSAVALELAEQLQAEIVALDSMTLYRGLDIGTAKPSVADQTRVPHHLLDVIAPHQEFSVAEYLSAADQACHEIVQRGHIPLFVGGTGLYLRSLLRGLFEGPPADWELRHRLETVEATNGCGTLHHQLQAVDPESARWLHPNDQRRIIRALEVFELTSTPLSQLQLQAELPPDARPKNVFWLEPPREWLYERIDRRVQHMFDAGLVAEVTALRSLPEGLSRTAGQALGYKEVLEYLEGRISLSDSLELIQTRSRQFAKRQHTWFRNLPECRAVSITGQESAGELAERLQREADAL
ncbi:MAG: miaA [Planctomycetaceae bacterium]|nr:miaA [Planctomycetaceae bacterium]